MSYDAYRKNKIESGLVYQDFAIDLLHRTIGIAVNQYVSRVYQLHVGESRSGIEIKHDEQYARTGNLWIEVAEKAIPRPGDYIPSGINRADNTWLYVIGDYNIVFGFQKTLLHGLSASGRYRRRENSFQTSVGFLLPDADARRYAAFILTPNAEHLVHKAITDLHRLGQILHEALCGNPAQRSLFEMLEIEGVQE